MPELAASRLSMGLDGSVTIGYSDNHQGRWAARLGFGARHTFDEFFLSKAGVIVVRYVSAYERPDTSRCGFMDMASGYSLERIVRYWQLGDEYIERRFVTDEDQPFYMRIVVAHHIITSARKDLADIIAGQHLMPKK